MITNTWKCIKLHCYCCLEAISHKQWFCVSQSNQEVIKYPLNPIDEQQERIKQKINNFLFKLMLPNLFHRNLINSFFSGINCISKLVVRMWNTIKSYFPPQHSNFIGTLLLRLAFKSCICQHIIYSRLRSF